MFDRGARRRGEIEAFRVEIERLRAFVEMRAQAQENMMRAVTLEAGARFAEAIEERIQLAAREAIAFAEQGLSQHEAALRALGRRVAELSRDASPLPPARRARGARRKRLSDRRRRRGWRRLPEARASRRSRGHVSRRSRQLADPSRAARRNSSPATSSNAFRRAN